VLETLGVRASLLVIPGRWNGQELSQSPAFVDWLHAAESRGHEIVQHGLLHTRDKNFASTSKRARIGQLLGRGCQEFWELPYEEAFQRLIHGKSIMTKCGFHATGFVAPAWMMSEGTLDALRDTGFQYTNNHTHLINTQTGEKKFVVVTSQRPRSLLSLPGVAVTNGIAKYVESQGKPLRIAIHPADLMSPRLREANLKLITQFFSRGYVSMTYDELCTYEFTSSAKTKSPVSKKNQLT
jgi:peptidoglycan/xylan/chitin deacetylase (PgdA/CDA1 family)